MKLFFKLLICIVQLLSISTSNVRPWILYKKLMQEKTCTRKHAQETVPVDLYKFVVEDSGACVLLIA